MPPLFACAILCARNANRQMSSVLDDVVDEIEPAPNVVSVMAGTKPSFLLSIDVGTSGVRAALFDERGNEVRGAQVRSHRGLPAVSSFAELDADALADEAEGDRTRRVDKNYDKFRRYEAFLAG